MDGMSIAVPQAGGTNYLTDTRNAQEVSFTTRAAGGGGVGRAGDEHRPAKVGGNSMSGDVFTELGKQRTAGQQLHRRTEGRRASRRRIRSSSCTISTARSAVRSGGPTLGLRHLRFQGNSNYIVNMYRPEPGNPNKWTYEPDSLTRRTTTRRG